MKIEIAQITSDPACLEDNAKKILQGVEVAKSKGSSLVSFPELALTGYGCMDIFLHTSFLHEQENALLQLSKKIKGVGAIVGFVDFDESRKMPDGTPLKYNAVALINNGEIRGIARKSLLPNYDVFDEKRYFAEERKRHLVKFKGIKLGLEICEDGWPENYLVDVSSELASMGADIIINSSASPFYHGKRLVRDKIFRATAASKHIPLIYTNLVGGQDGFDGEIIFDGQSMAFDKNGFLISLAKPFQEQFLTVDLDADNKNIEPPPFNPSEETYNALVFGVKEYFRRTGNKIAHIGLSGGVDSALVAAIAVDALGADNVYGYSMPSRYSSQGSKDDAKNLADNLGCHLIKIPINDPVESFDRTSSPVFSGRKKGVTEENIQARIRGVILMSMSNEFGGLVLTTGNKTEVANGYMTLYGDMAGGLAVIGDLPKMQVYELARFRNAQAGKDLIPNNSIIKPPSAELRPDQTDEASLGSSYEILSPLTEAIVLGDINYRDLIQNYPEELVIQVLSRIKRSEYKRKQAAPSIKVTRHSFGHSWRYPIIHKWEGW